MLAVKEKIKLKTFKDLIAWQKSYALCLHIYEITKHFPKTEQFGLTSQLKRSALSVPSNIAEGYTRHSTQDYLRFLYIAYSSLAELETQLLLAKDLTYIKDTAFSKTDTMQREVQRIMYGLIKSLKK